MEYPAVISRSGFIFMFSFSILRLQKQDRRVENRRDSAIRSSLERYYDVTHVTAHSIMADGWRNDVFFQCSFHVR